MYPCGEVGEPLRMRHRTDPADPHVRGQRCQTDHVEGRLFKGVGGAQCRQNTMPDGRRRDYFHAVLSHSFQRPHRADHRRSVRAGQELTSAGHAPTAVRILTDSARAGGEQCRAQRLGIPAGHEDHPLVQSGTAHGRFENRLDSEPQGLGQRVGYPRSGGIGVGVGGEER